MKRQTKILTISILLILVLALIINSFYLTSNVIKQDQVIKVGVIAPFTGRMASWGENIKDSLELYVDQHQGFEIELIYEDSKCNPQEGVSAAQKLINIDDVEVIIGGVCSSVTLAVAPIAEKNEVVLITPVSQSSSIKDAGDYVFRIALANDVATKALAEKAYNDGNKKVGILYVLNDFGKDYEKHFSKYFNEVGGRVEVSEGYDIKERDFSASLSKIKAENVEGLVIFTTVEGSLIAKKVAELDLDVDLYGSPTWNSKPNTAGVEEIVEDLVFVSNKVDFASPKYKEFATEFKAKYGYLPKIPWMAANAYDVLDVVLISVEKSGYEGREIKQGLYKIKNKQGVGGKIGFDNNGDSFNEVQLMVLEKGKGC